MATYIAAQNLWSLTELHKIWWCADCMNQNEIVQWKQKFIVGVPFTIAQAKRNYGKYHILEARYFGRMTSGNYQKNPKI